MYALNLREISGHSKNSNVKKLTDEKEDHITNVKEIHRYIMMLICRVTLLLLLLPKGVQPTLCDIVSFFFFSLDVYIYIYVLVVCMR
jgi:hypothetical protein